MQPLMRRERLIGLALIVLAIAIGVVFFMADQYSAELADRIVEMGGECVDDEGCLHQSARNWLLIGLIPTALVLAAGVYAAFFLKVTTYGDRIRKDEAFEIMLRSLSDDERKIMRIVHEEEGITQATLKYRADLSKSKLSQVLTDIEGRGLIVREEYGATKKVYLRRPDEAKNSL